MKSRVAAKPLKLIPQSVLLQCLNLSLEQVAAVMEAGGATVTLDSATCLGMMPGGAFVYQCAGSYFREKYKDQTGMDFTLVPEPWPDYLATFKIKVAVDKKFVQGFKPEFRAKAAVRVLDKEYVLFWA